MKNIPIYAAILFSIAGCVQNKTSTIDRQKEVDEMMYYAKESHSIFLKQMNLINGESKDFSTMLDNVKNADISQGNNSISCSRYSDVFKIKNCMMIGEDIKDSNMRMKLVTAGYLSKNGKNIEAKSLYRAVVVECNKASCKPLAKQAEFGIEDIKP